MNGLEKSITFSLSDVMVKAATARSAFCRIDKDRKVDRESWGRERDKGSGGESERETISGQVTAKIERHLMLPLVD